jgi:glutathione synthase/RimK-type ligase-like ATP-grasp enzyme
MKNVFLIKSGDISKKSLPVRRKRSKAYKHLFALGAKRGFTMAWSSADNFVGSKFNAYYILDGKKWKLETKPMKPDFILDKSYATLSMEQKKIMAVKAPFMDPIQLQLLVNDKFLTAAAFPGLIQPGIIVRTQDQLIAGLKKIKTNDVVIKPLASSGGREIEILPKQKMAKYKLSRPMLIQEFIDSSKGVPGLYKGIHDFRLLFLSNKLVHAYIRTCAPNSKLCNVALGGGRVIVPLSKVPKEMLKISKVFQKRFAQFHNSFYSIDFMYKDGKTPIVIEANVKPGLVGGDGTSEHHKILYTALLDHIEKYV